MWQILLLSQLALTFLLARGQNGCIGHPTFRHPGQGTAKIDPSALWTPPPLISVSFHTSFLLNPL